MSLPALSDYPTLAALLPHEQAVADLALVLRHRLSSLTSSIEGYADLLVDTLATDDQRDLVMRIFEGVRGIEAVLFELDVMGTPIMLDRQRVSLDDLLRELHAALGADVHRFYTHIEAAGPFWADGKALFQVLHILLKNALETSRKAAVVLEVAEADGAATFDVWNEGVPDVPEGRLFAPFYTTKSHHLGLGLAYARRIARLHGGDVTLHLASAKLGTCFRLTLPLDECPMTSVACGMAPLE